MNNKEICLVGYWNSSTENPEILLTIPEVKVNNTVKYIPCIITITPLPENIGHSSSAHAIKENKRKLTKELRNISTILNKGIKKK